jgi:hypothetical protein
MHLLATALSMVLAAAAAAQPDPRVAFFDALKALCNVRFEGAKTFPADTTHEMHGKLLVATVTTCTDTELRVPFVVGTDHSRTWVFTRPANGLQLKHDHRHADGTPDSVTNYGGMARTGGSALEQAFPADEFTARLIPAAATNVWTIRLSADRSTLTYHLDRNGQPRFTAVLRRVMRQ